MSSILSLSDAVVRFAAAEAVVTSRLEKSLDRAAERIQASAKEKIGEYQAANGVHGAWPQLADSTKAERVRLGYTENDPGLRNGAMRNSIKRETKGLESVIGSDDQNLVWFELGTEKQPPRSVLGAAAYENLGEVTKLVGGAVVTGIVGALSLGHKV